MQIHVSLNGKAAGSQIIEIESAVRMHRAFDVLGGLFDLHISRQNKLFQRAQSMMLVVLRLDFRRRAGVKRNRAPSQRLDVLHCKLEQLVVRQIRWKLFHR